MYSSIFKIVPALVLIVIVPACYTTKQKQEYTAKRLLDLNKYGTFSIDIDFSGGSMNDSTRAKEKMRKIRRTANQFERAVATTPDSTSINALTGKADLYYKNIHKIKYLKKHRLVTPEKYLVQ